MGGTAQLFFYVRHQLVFETLGAIRNSARRESGRAPVAVRFPLPAVTWEQTRALVSLPYNVLGVYNSMPFQKVAEATSSRRKAPILLHPRATC